MIVYAVLHNPMYHESAARTISLHLSKRGAYQARQRHKNKEYTKERDSELENGRPFRRPTEYLAWQWWGIKAITVEE